MEVEEVKWKIGRKIRVKERENVSMIYIYMRVRIIFVLFFIKYLEFSIEFNIKYMFNFMRGIGGRIVG